MSFQVSGKGPIASKTSKIQNYLDDKVRAKVAPKGSRGISGWEFSIPDSEQINLSAEITDNVVESGSFISDHVVIKPKRLVLSGFVGEAVDEPPQGVDASVQALRGTLSSAGSFANSIPVISGYLGEYTDGMVQVIQGAVDRVEEVTGELNELVDKVDNIAGLFLDSEPSPSKQEQAYENIRALWESRQIVTVHTPWSYFDSMVIESISVTQSGDTKFMTDFSITLKEVRFAEIEKVAYDENLFPPRTEIQETPEQDQGTVEGERNSFAFDAFTALGGGS